MANTLDITPDWAGMRRFVAHVAQTDLSHAQNIARSLNSEAPFTVTNSATGEFKRGFATYGLALDYVCALPAKGRAAIKITDASEL